MPIYWFFSLSFSSLCSLWIAYGIPFRCKWVLHSNIKRLKLFAQFVHKSDFCEFTCIPSICFHHTLLPHSLIRWMYCTLSLSLWNKCIFIFITWFQWRTQLNTFSEWMNACNRMHSCRFQSWNFPFTFYEWKPRKSGLEAYCYICNVNRFRYHSTFLGSLHQNLLI